MTARASTVEGLLLTLAVLGGCERAAAPRETWPGPRCGTDAAPKPDHDPAPMCWVPPGELTMGARPEHAGPFDVPPRRVRVSRGFYMDQHEVTVEQFVRFVNAVDNRCDGALRGECIDSRQQHDDQWTRSPTGYQVVAARARHPIKTVRISAAAYCAWAAKELPTEAQWELAALHDPATGRDRHYPWGDAFAPGLANCTQEPGSRDLDGTAPVGSCPRDVSPAGILDLGGNATEWVRDCWDPAPSCPEPCVDPVGTDACVRDPACVDGVHHGNQQCGLVRGGAAGFPVHLMNGGRRFRIGLDLNAAIRCIRS